ncbi:DEAD/DEAH box helicase [Halomonas sp. Mc5H-6]|uniref:SNF2-related protein n=1 Tax=Halomonas sp. Mc5H-6 TaxID=2954500 RepID=UPI002096E6AD|nr:DEAD/DEAH box helicase [Halomonas sp. Mc5H-6]MCO7246385.1 DEAD/DEAH box helicase [Halomonas sp. Mc5H-6]
MTEAASLQQLPTLALRSTPMTHQVAAFENMRPSKVGALFMDMGTGKSLVVIMLALARREKISRVIWCCPVSLKRNTARQIFTHTNATDDSVFLFDDKVTDASLPEAGWCIVGLESLGSSDRVVMALNKLIDERTMLVVDESSYIKGHRAKRTRRLVLMGKRARYRLVLNGTPISQGIEDLYSQMQFLSDKILGYRSWYSFQRAHLEWSEKFKGKIDKRRGEDYLTARMAPYVYQITKEECLDLPEKLPATSRYVSLTSEQQHLYDQAKERFENEAMSLEEEDGMGIIVYRLFGALQAIASGVVPAGFEGHGQPIKNNKVDEQLRVLRQLDRKHTVVWCRYQGNVKQLAAAIAEEMPEVPVFTYYGVMNERQRDNSLQAWVKEGGVFLGTASCGGYGLNELVEADYATFFSNSFKYSERLQAEDRLHRPGQVRNVSYVDIWAKCGIEERIEKAINRKGDALETFRKELDAAREKGKGAVETLLRGL